MSYYGEQFFSSATQATGQSLARILVDTIRKQLPGRQTQRGEYYVEHTRGLIKNDFELMEPAEKIQIQLLFEAVIDKRQALETEGDSRRQRFRKAREFKCRSKQLYVVTKTISGRVRNVSLLNDMRRAAGTTELNVQNPFADPPAAPIFTSAPVDSLRSVEVAEYESETTGERAVGLTIQNEDATTEEVIAPIPPEAFADSRMDLRVQTTGSIPLNAEQHPQEHSRDGSTRQSVATLSESNQEAETDTSSHVAENTSGVLGPP